jgi:hypothetical protein
MNEKRPARSACVALGRRSSFALVPVVHLGSRTSGLRAFTDSARYFPIPVDPGTPHMARSRGTQGGSTRGRSLHAAAIRRALRSGGRRHIAHCQGAFDARATPLYPAVGDGYLRSEITLPNLQDHPVPVSAVGGCTKISSLPLNLQRNPDSTGSSWRAPRPSASRAG